MKKYIFHLASFSAIVLAISIGCASIKPYAKFAQAGTTYTEALDRLLVTARDTAIDATSERLLQDDALANMNPESYEKFSDADRDRILVIEQLRAHARLLARYFSLLNELAGSGTQQENIEKSLSGVAERLNSIGNQLRGSDLISNKDAFASINKALVGALIKARLKAELHKHKDMIQLEIKTQKELLKALKDQIEHDLTNTNQVREQRQVITPLIDIKKIENQDRWVDQRRTILISPATVAELETASEAAQKLTEAFEKLVKGELNGNLIDNLVIDLKSIISGTEAFHHEREAL